MKHWLVCSVLVLTLLTLARESEAQPFAFIDATTRNVGVGGGMFFGRGPIQPGLFADVYHGNELTQFAPDAEVMAALSWTVNDRWYVLGAVGGGVAFATESADWSLRTLFFVTGSQDIAFRMSLFGQWTPDDGSVFLQPRVGPSVRLGRTGHRVFPNIGLGLNIPTNGESVSARFVPGCTVILNL